MTARTKQELYDRFSSGGSATHNISQIEQEFEDLIDSIGVTGSLTVAASDASNASKGRADYRCDGTADNVEIQAALDALPAAGGKVVLSEGTFTITTGITETSDNVHIQGAGMEATKIVPADALTAFTFDGAPFGSISDLSISAASQQTSGAGVHWYKNCYQMHAERVFINNMYDGFIVESYIVATGVSQVYAGWITDCVFWETKNDVFSLLRFCGLFIEGCIAWNTTNCANGIHWTGGTAPFASEALWIRNCDFMLCGVGFHIDNTDGDISLAHLFLNNVAFDTGSGAGVYITGTNTIWQLHFDNLWCSGSTAGHGFVLYDASGLKNCSLTSPKLQSNYNSGIWINSGSNIQIIGGTINDNNQEDSGTLGEKHGIYMYAGTDVSIIGTRIGNVAGTGNQDYGIYLETGVTRAMVQSCNLLDNDTAGMYAADWTDSMARNNYGTVTENSGTSAIASGQTTKVVAHGLATTPTAVSIDFREQGTSDYGRWWVSALGSTGFTLNVSADPGASNLDFGWEAKVR